MNITIGTGWAITYAILALIGIIGGAIWLIWNSRERNSVVGPLVVLVLGIGSAYLWSYAATHFRVPVNQRALLINTIDQQVIGTRESGIQTRPIFGVKVMLWPAYTQYDLTVDMAAGIDSATTSNNTPVYVDTRLYLDLSAMDIVGMYKASNGNFDVFLEKNLRPGMRGVARNVSIMYTTLAHSNQKTAWQLEYEKQLNVYLSDATKGFGIKLLPNRTVMTWDFVSPDDAKAFDDANRAAYLVMQRENEKAALMIEKEMAQTRSEMLLLSANGTVDSLQAMSDFIQSQPESIRPYLIQYMDTLVSLEYLRLVGEQKPASFLPPGSSTVPTYNFNQPLTIPAPAPAETAVPNQ
jgi:hypothetical protein